KLSENTGGVHLADAGNGLQAFGAWNAVQNSRDCLVQILELRLNASDGLNGCAQHKVNGILHNLGQPVRGSGGLLNAASDVLGVREAIAPLVSEVVSQIRDIHVRNVVQAVLVREHLQDGMTEYGTLDFGRKGIALVEQVLQEVLLLAC